jgi:hypothetical protein
MDVGFYNVIPFGNREHALKVAQERYALATYFDERSQLTKALQVYQVPVKVFLEDGVIKKTWLDATIDRRAQADFRDWLSRL